MQPTRPPRTRPPRTRPPRTRARPRRSTILAGLALVAAVALGVVALSPADFTHDVANTPAHAGAAATPVTQRTGLPRVPGVPAVPAGHDSRGHRGQTTSLADEGAVQGGVTVFDDRSPAVTKLDPALLSALRTAARDADDDGVELLVNSGWRSAAYQEQLLQEAVAKYGSRKEAARWVATPETSAHVSGDAVDLGPLRATSWLSHHGAAYGLCQVYRNEPWHYELRPGAVDHGCPAMYADPTHDPRVQQ